jgi:hypothetical protein
MAKKRPHDPSVPQRIPEGFLLLDTESVGNQTVFLWFFSLFWTIWSAIALFATLHDPINPVSLFMALFISIFVIVGLFMVGMSLLETWKNLKLYPAELILPSYPLRLGESCTIQYRRRLRKGSFSRAAQLEAKFVCDEWVQYTQGTDTVTKNHLLWETILPSKTVDSGERQADYIGGIDIRPEGPPSFFAEHNKIRWQLIIKLRAPGIPSACISTFLINVLPESIATP